MAETETLREAKDKFEVGETGRRAGEIEVTEAMLDAGSALLADRYIADGAYDLRRGVLAELYVVMTEARGASDAMTRTEIEAARADEREACAKLADAGAFDAAYEITVGERIAGHRTAKLIAAAIRARALLSTLPGEADNG
jgi:hypothetical protein